MPTTTSHLLMIRPANFGYNEETAPSNAFQEKPGELDPLTAQTKALEEFDQLVDLLKLNGIDVMVVEDTLLPVKTDAIFPNNWISTHEDGTVVTYPMLSPNRRLERRQDIVEALGQRFRIEQHLSLEQYETEGIILEGTGSLILDRDHKVAYACLSPRTDWGLVRRFGELLGYETLTFHAVDAQGKEIYHTNVMMALGNDFAIVCLETIQNQEQRQSVENSLLRTGKEIIDISWTQMQHFAGNMLQVHNTEGDSFLVMSRQAFDCLSQEQIARIRSHTNILYSAIPTIERLGGGSVRCMMAEIFLPNLVVTIE